MTRNLLLSGGPAHDFDVTSQSLARLFDEEGITTVVVDEPGDALARLRTAGSGATPPFDLLTVNALHWGMGVERYAHLRAQHGYTLEQSDAAVIDRFVRNGGGLLALHTAVICFDAEPTWQALCGATWNWDSSSHGPVGETAVVVTDAGHRHPLTEGLDDFTVLDEVYEGLDAAAGITPLLSGSSDLQSHPLLWAREIGDGRVVTDLLGHGIESVEHPTHRTILRNAARWLQNPTRSGSTAPSRSSAR